MLASPTIIKSLLVTLPLSFSRPLVQGTHLNLVSSKSNNFSLDHRDIGSDTILNFASKMNVFFCDSNDSNIENETRWPPV